VVPRLRHLGRALREEIRIKRLPRRAKQALAAGSGGAAAS
jgi:predicted GIY-YIG superfamily endonuclease